MTFITGPMFSGKRRLAMELLGCGGDELSRRAVWDVEELAAGREDLEVLADELARHEVVIAHEVGSGVVPVDPEQRRRRETAGRLSCLLAARADRVIRVFCGIPTVLKGEKL